MKSKEIFQDIQEYLLSIMNTERERYERLVYMEDMTNERDENKFYNSEHYE